MKEILICLLFATAFQESLQSEKMKIQAVHITRPELPKPENFTKKRLEIIKEKLKPQIDGLPKGNIPQPDDAGRHTNNTKPGKVNLHITNGVQAARGQFPWQVGMEIDGSSFCGGSIISEDYILTAAHCTDKSRSLLITIGALYTQKYDANRYLMYGRRKIVHPYWDQNIVLNDISLVLLPYKVIFTDTIKPIRLPDTVQATYSFVNATVIVSGWGRTSNVRTDTSNVLLFIQTNVVSMMECVRTYGSENIYGSMLCVRGKHRSGQSTCQGDSGGPLVHLERDGLYTQLGIVSFGPGAGCGKGYPDVFTRVSSYLGWISSVTGLAIPINHTKSTGRKGAQNKDKAAVGKKSTENNARGRSSSANDKKISGKRQNGKDANSDSKKEN